jgi:hypothetical protein
LGDVEPGRKWPAPGVMGPRFAGGIRSTLSFITEHGLTPQQFDPGCPLVGPDAAEASTSRRQAARV